MGDEHTSGRPTDAGGRARGPGVGWWPSPLTAPAVAAGKVSRAGLRADGAHFLWTESRPGEGGRQVVVVDRDGATPAEVTPAGMGVRSRVHEYGGGAAWPTADGPVVVAQDDQRLYRLPPGGGPPEALTPDPGPGGGVRWADGTVTPSGRWLVCVEERVGRAVTTHRLVAVAADGSLRTVTMVAGRDFVAAPRVAPDGARLAWVTWDHPAMPWDASELWVAGLEETDAGPAVTGAHRIAGGPGRSVGQPHWTRDGDLLYVDDRTGWWLPYRLGPAGLDGTDPVVPPVLESEAEFHAPDWALGQSTLAELPDGSIACRMHRDGTDHLVRLVATGGDAEAWSCEVIAQPCVSIAGVAVAGDRLAVLGSTPTAASVVLEVVPGGGVARRLSTPLDGAGEPDPATVSTGRPFVADTPSGPVPGLVFEPVGGGHPAPGDPGDPAPLVVFCHGGPTGATDPGYNPVVQFLTSRGLAVAAVDYRGSSGYGRAYRQRLQGGWGVYDVEDCTAYAVALAEAGVVDGHRMAIRGTSAGGLTALGALVGSERFLGAVSWYGVTDLESLATDTHDFEARYLDGLVGPLPGARAEYRRRSPVHRAADLRGAVLLLQGADDPVVPLSQAEGFAEALAAQGVSCRLQVFEGESHGFRRASTIEACLLAELDFYRSLFAPGGVPATPGPS